MRDILRGLPLFKGLPDGPLRELATLASRRHLPQGEQLFEEGEVGSDVYVVVSGIVRISKRVPIIDQFPADQQGQIRTMLASSLKGVIAQNLLKKKGGGRVAAMEVLVVNNAVRANIREGKTHQIQMAMQVGGKLGMVELNTALLRLVVDGKVTPEEALAKAIDKDGLTRSLASRGLASGQSDAAPTIARVAPQSSGVPQGAPTHTSELSAIDVRRAIASQTDPKETAARIAETTQKKSRWFQ